jgi:hypothetical protein
MKKQFQLELFQSQKYQPDSSHRRQYHRSFFGFIRAYEKTITMVIVFLIVSLISFSLGVEKGKRLARLIQNEAGIIDRAQLEKKLTLPEPEQSSTQKPSPDKELKKEVIPEEYTVQVASFKTKTYAQKEADRLKEKGLDALIRPSGNYVIVCIGNFSKKQEAQVALDKLRQMYHDCYIRRL